MTNHNPKFTTCKVYQYARRGYVTSLDKKEIKLKEYGYGYTIYAIVDPKKPFGWDEFKKLTGGMSGVFDTLQIHINSNIIILSDFPISHHNIINREYVYYSIPTVYITEYLTSPDLEIQKVGKQLITEYVRQKELSKYFIQWNKKYKIYDNMASNK